MKIDPAKIIETFNSLNEQMRYGIFAGIVVLFVVLDVLIFVLPQVHGIVQISEEITKTSADIERVTTDKQRIEQLNKSLNTARLQLESMKIKIRPVQEVPAILESISRIANENSVKIDQIIPQKQEQETVTSSREGNYYALPIVIQARCGYHMFGRFLNRLENEDLYFTLKDLVIQGNEKDPNLHAFTVTIKVILFDQPSVAEVKKS